MSSRPSVFAVLKGHYDGGGNTGHGSVKTVALAGYFANDEDWIELEKPWAQVIGDGPAMHAYEAFHCCGKYKGWDRGAAHRRLGDCVEVLAALDRQRFHGVSCVVPIHEFERAKQDRPRLEKKAIHALCVDHCVGPMFRSIGHDDRDPNRYMKQIVFDRNEKFLRYIDQVWRGPRSKHPWWVPYCDSVSSANSERVLPLQAADVLAWTVRRNYAEHDCDEWHAALVSGYADPSAHVVYDHARLLQDVREGVD
jgi:hypothetical protein